MSAARKIISGLAAVTLLGGALGCERFRQKPVDVAPITTADDNIAKNETDLLDQRGSLQKERKQLADARAEIVDRRQKVGRDAAGQAALDEEERKLLAQENSLTNRESEINSKLDDLLRMRADLVKRATQAVATAPGADPLERAAHREQTVATREKEIARREAEVATREKDLADREMRQARREKETCGTPAVAIADASRGLKYSARDVEPVYKKALKVMQERGLLASDLPPGVSGLVDGTRESMKKGDYVRAKYDADQLLGAIEETKIDRSFISGKMNRLAAAMKGHKLDGGERHTVESLFQEATANYGDGKFPQANSKINRLFGMLK